MAPWLEICSEWEILEYSVLNGMSSCNLFSQGSGSYVEENVERLQEPEKLDDTKETVLSSFQNIAQK